MEAVSFVVLILLSLMGYSAGAVGKAGRLVELRPQIIDLILVLAIWAGGIYSRIALDLDKWLVIPAWAFLSVMIGVLAIWPRKLSEEIASREKDLTGRRQRETSKNLLKKLWGEWQGFFSRAGSLQSRIALSLFFLILVSPLALGVKTFSDPLGIKHPSNESYWLPKMKTEAAHLSIECQDSQGFA